MGAEAPQVYQGYAGRKRTKKRPESLFVFCFSGTCIVKYTARKKKGCGNDPSAGSPTETLLRLHLPLNDEV